ncbi:MAG: hypothetical protein OEM41_01125 [Ignavibacteria bacterium]|nr:hypothetical protein [Ignavibacteria bacterium]
MTRNRSILTGVLVAMMTLGTIGEALAESACAARRRQCNGDCNEEYTGDTLGDSVMRNGCRLGCGAAYVVCVVASTL